MTSQLALSHRYQIALQTHLRDGVKSRMPTAHRLGQQAVALGVDTLELARIHERAFAALNIAPGKDGTHKRAELFFNEVITPIVETHRAVRQNQTNLNQLKNMLVRRTSELASANRQLHRGLLKRESVEAALKKSGAHYTKMLSESLHIQQGLRKLTHKLIAVQEVERKNISAELREEIAQTLLGINVRLVSLKRDARTKSKDLKNEIASTQQLVAKSARSVRRVARKFRNA